MNCNLSWKPNWSAAARHRSSRASSERPTAAIRLTDQNGQLTLEPGSVSRLGAWRRNLLSPLRPNRKYFAPYVTTQLRAIASALNMPY